jgi:hypothetical protein
MTTLAIILYLAGYVLAYLIGRGWGKSMFFNWTVGDRKFWLVLSLGSFITALISGLTWLFIAMSDNDKPAKW